MPFINGIGPLELIIILAIALIVVGPGRLPDVGAALGKSIREFRKAATDVKDATSLEPAKPEAAPAAPPAAAAPAVAAASSATPPPVVAPPPAPPVVDAPPPALGDTAVPIDPALQGVSETPVPAPVADEQPTRTA
jgi:TatA/E family protein of Tat protein translocase